MEPSGIDILSSSIVPAAAALLGALVGSIGTVLTVYIQARREDRRQIRQLAVQLALAEKAEHDARPAPAGGALYYPLDLYVAHHAEIVMALSKGRITPRDVTRIFKRQDKLKAALEEADARRSVDP